MLRVEIITTTVIAVTAMTTANLGIIETITFVPLTTEILTHTLGCRSETEEDLLSWKPNSEKQKGMLGEMVG